MRIEGPRKGAFLLRHGDWLVPSLLNADAHVSVVTNDFVPMCMTMDISLEPSK